MKTQKSEKGGVESHGVDATWRIYGMKSASKS